MSKSIKKFLPQKKRWWALIIIASLAAVMIATGKKEEENIAPIDYDPETTPTMYTSDATSYVSDSGYTRYYIETTQWFVFDDAKEPNWKFPEGLYGEKFDNDMQVIATFECDSAVYLSSPKIWELSGNVRINNEFGDRFLTQHMFWNTAEHKMYSDSFIHIEKSDRIIEGYGFISDERISDYVVHRPSMIIPASELSRDRSGKDAADSLQAPVDTMATGMPQRRPPRPREGYPAAVPATNAPTPGGHIPGSHNARQPQLPIGRVKAVHEAAPAKLSAEKALPLKK
jgi:LPS export ABC transporter protein LptC